VNKNRYELLDEALLFEIGATRRLYKAIREGQSAERAHGDFDHALERWIILRADLDADETTSSASKFTTDFMAGIDETMFSPRAVWSLRASVCWALGTRSSHLPVPRDEFPVQAEGDLVIQALLEMVNPWEASALLAAVETRVGESLNEFLLRPSRHAGLENLAEIVLMARDYMFRSEYLAQIEEILEHHRVRARVEFYRPALQQLIDRVYLVARELILWGPAVQSPYFSREGTAHMAARPNAPN